MAKKTNKKTKNLHQSKLNSNSSFSKNKPFLIGSSSTKSDASSIKLANKSLPLNKNSIVALLFSIILILALSKLIFFENAPVGQAALTEEDIKEEGYLVDDSGGVFKLSKITGQWVVYECSGNTCPLENPTNIDDLSDYKYYLSPDSDYEGLTEDYSGSAIEISTGNKVEVQEDYDQGSFEILEPSTTTSTTSTTTTEEIEQIEGFELIDFESIYFSSGELDGANPAYLYPTGVDSENIVEKDAIWVYNNEEGDYVETAKDSEGEWQNTGRTATFDKKTGEMEINDGDNVQIGSYKLTKGAPSTPYIADPDITQINLPEDIYAEVTSGNYKPLTNSQEDEITTIIFYDDTTDTQREIQFNTGSENKVYRLKEEITETPEEGGPYQITKNIYYNSIGELILSTDSSKQTEDGKQIVTFSNSQYYSGQEFYVDSGFNEQDGTCSKNNYCIKSTTDTTDENEVESVAVYWDYASHDTGHVAHVTESKNANGKITSRTEDYYSGETKNLLGKTVLINKKYSFVDEDGDETGGKDDTEKITQYSGTTRTLLMEYQNTGGDTGSRIYYGEKAGFFKMETAVSTDENCYRQTSCDVVSFIDESGEYGTATFFEDTNGNGQLDSGETKTESAEFIKSKSKDGVGFFEAGNFYEDELRDACGEKSNCDTVISKARSAHRKEVMMGQTDQQQVMGAVLGAWSDTTLQPLSSALCGDCFAGAVEWLDDLYVGSVFDSGRYESKVCSAAYEDLRAEQGVIISETLSGTIQGLGTANAEYSGPQPIMCDADKYENDGCPEGNYCENEFCYDQDTREITEGYLYYITWGVTAPYDEELTPYADESAAVNYNIVLQRKISDSEFSDPIRLYSYQGDSSHPLTLQNGESDGQKIVHMSPDLDVYTHICIEWGNKPPKTAPMPMGEILDFEGMAQDVNNLCNEIKEGDISAVSLVGGLVDSTSSSASSSTAEQSITTSDTDQASVDEDQAEKNENW